MDSDSTTAAAAASVSPITVVFPADASRNASMTGGWGGSGALQGQLAAGSAQAASAAAQGLFARPQDAEAAAAAASPKHSLRAASHSSIWRWRSLQSTKSGSMPSLLRSFDTIQDTIRRRTASSNRPSLDDGQRQSLDSLSTRSQVRVTLSLKSSP